MSHMSTFFGGTHGTVQVDAQEIGDKGDPTELIAARMAAAEHGCLAIKVCGSGHGFFARVLTPKI